MFDEDLGGGADSRLAGGGWANHDASVDELLAAVAAELRAEVPLVIADDDEPEEGTLPEGGRWPGTMDAGVRLARWLAEVRIDETAAADLVDLVAGWQRLANWAQARQAAAIVELTRRPELQPLSSGAAFPSLHPVTITAAELAAPLGLTSPQAQRLVGHAVQLVEDFPATFAAFGAGRLDARRVRVITDELAAHDPDVRHGVEAAVLAAASAAGESGALSDAEGAGPEATDGFTPLPDSTVLRRLVKRTLHAVAPTAMAERRARAQRERRVTVTPAADGMAWLEAYLTAEDVTAVKTCLDSAASALTAQDRKRRRANREATVRTPAQARADALTQLAWSALGAGRIGSERQHDPVDPNATSAGRPRSPDDESPSGEDASRERDLRPIRLRTRHGRPVTVNLTMPIGMLLADGSPTSRGGLDDVAVLEGYGPIPPDVALRLATDASWRRLLTDPVSGVLLDYGTTRYTPPQALIDHIVARDRECRAPGCHRSAAESQLDHTIPYPTGPTSNANLGVLCAHHHALKHHTRWRLEQPEPGVFRWISPTGRVHLTRSEKSPPET